MSHGGYRGKAGEPRTECMYIAGEWVDALDGCTFEDKDPYTGEICATVAGGSAADASRAISAAQEAFPGWAATLPSERRTIFLKAADLLEEHVADIAATLTQETGATVPFARWQTMMTAGILRECASHVHRMTGEVIPSDTPGQVSMTIRRPVGVVAGIGPWNGPLILCMRSVAYPMAYGNTAVLKPSADAALSGGVVIARLFEEAGLPPGVLNLVTNAPGKSSEVGDTLVRDPRVRRISFTGSTAVGRGIAEQAGRLLKQVTLELGGSDAFIVLGDADIDWAVDAAIFGRFIHSGQVCMSSKRILLERSIADQFTTAFVRRAEALKCGDPSDPTTAVGPMINRSQRDAVHAQVQQSLAQGAVIACGGTFEGNVYRPTVLLDVTCGMQCMEEEVFGPVASLVVVEDLDEAVSIANRSPFGLSSAVFTRDLRKALDIAERLETGSVHINDSSVNDEPQVPFGGVKESGYGKHGGTECIDEFTDLKWITYQKTSRHYPI